MAMRRRRVGAKIADMSGSGAKQGRTPMTFGVAGYAIVRDSEAEALREVDRITDVKQSAARLCELRAVGGRDAVGARGFAEGLFGVESRAASGFVGTPEQVAERIAAFEKAGVDLVLLQFSPQLEEMEAFSKAVIGKNAGSLARTAS